MVPSRNSAWALALLLTGCSSSAQPGGSPSESDASAPEVDGADDAPTRDSTTPPAEAHVDSGGDATVASDSGSDSSEDATGNGHDDAGNSCSVFGAPGECIDTSSCVALTDPHTPYPGQCVGGTANIQCCIDTPDTADNPPAPAGWVLMQQSMVTAAMTSWAVTILHDYAGYPMFSTTTMVFGSQLVMARVEWHPPDFQNSVVHRGVTLYVPTD
jgi:hypothetical protein